MRDFDEEEQRLVENLDPDKARACQSVLAFCLALLNADEEAIKVTLNTVVDRTPADVGMFMVSMGQLILCLMDAHIENQIDAIMPEELKMIFGEEKLEDMKSTFVQKTLQEFLLVIAHKAE